MHGQVGSFWKILSEQTIRILVGTALPRTLWITEVDINISCQRETLVVRKLFATIPCEGLVEFPRQFV